MSVATEVPPVVHIPERARRSAERLATVIPLRPRETVALVGPGSLRDTAHALPRVYPVRPVAGSARVRRDEAARATLRLTHRGYLAIAVLVGVLSAGLLWLAHASVPPARVAGSVPAVVTVHDGETLWAIASRIAPQRDPRTVVADLERINHLPGPDVQPGQVLHTR